MRIRNAVLPALVAALVGVALVLPGQMPADNDVATESPIRNTDKARSPRAIVVGAGISGLTTALELGRGGAEVTVVDMSSVFGGHAVMSQGGVSVIDTPLQRESGILDNADMANGDFLKWGEDADPEWVTYYVNNSRRDIYEWLTDLGVRFEGVLPAPGNSVDRFHQPAGRGIGLVTPLYRECLKQKRIRFLWNVQAIRLLQRRHRVTGVRLRNLRTNSEQSLHADAVVLATGGYGRAYFSATSAHTCPP